METATAEAAAGGGVSSKTIADLLPAAAKRFGSAPAVMYRGDSGEWVERSFAEVGEEARAPGRDDLAVGDRDLSERIARVYQERGLAPPSPAEVTATVQHRQKVVEGLIGYLVKKGTLIRLSGGWLISRHAVEELVARLRASGKPGFEIAEFKEMFGLTRKLAIPLLEYLDGEKVTRRVGDRREIVR